ncbi:Uncharacterised protein [Mycobacteroides abscessus subsp. abscessus]|nr:Uncharacterised protein [Mycobacteroides abscessus subsp. abscessus]
MLPAQFLGEIRLDDRRGRLLHLQEQRRTVGIGEQRQIATRAHAADTDHPHHGVLELVTGQQGDHILGHRTEVLVDHGGRLGQAHLRDADRDVLLLHDSVVTVDSGGGELA